jgi:HPt (histidine-containing phosphotransfer) domain-containing protein
MTAHAMRQDRDRCLAAGMDEFLSKPVQREDLVAVLERFLALRAPVDQAGAAGSSPMATAAIDWSVLGGMRDLPGESGDFLGEVIELFLEQARSHLDHLVGAARGGELTTFRRTAHTLKGAASSVGATRLATCAGRIEDLCREQNLTAAIGAIPELQAELERACQALSAGPAAAG